MKTIYKNATGKEVNKEIYEAIIENQVTLFDKCFIEKNVNTKKSLEILRVLDTPKVIVVKKK